MLHLLHVASQGCKFSGYLGVKSKATMFSAILSMSCAHMFPGSRPPSHRTSLPQVEGERILEHRKLLLLHLGSTLLNIVDCDPHQLSRVPDQGFPQVHLLVENPSTEVPWVEPEASSVENM